MRHWIKDVIVILKKDFNGTIDGSDVVVNTESSSILGIGVLGKMILGRNIGVKTLGTPVIRLAFSKKLTAPTIKLIVDDMNKLDAPVIKLVAPKLTTPEIYLEVEQEEELPKLTRPVIELETIILALDAPIIELKEV